MKVKLILFNVMSSIIKNIPEYEEFTVEIKDSTTLSELFEKASNNIADVSKYYFISGKYYQNLDILPYVICSDNKIKWEVPYHIINVNDFLKTHDINDNIIKADTGITQSGGPGLKDFFQLWNEYYPIIDQIATVFGLTGFGIWIRSLFINKKIPPHGIFDLILSRNIWNHHELSELLEISQEDTKNILKGLGYKWDNVKKAYTHNDRNSIRKKFSKVNLWDHG